MIRRLVLFALFSGLFFVIVELLLALLSNPECGTVAIPCTYTNRLYWNLYYGSWMADLFIWVLANIIFYVITIMKSKK
jgi:hypothetical protein